MNTDNSTLRKMARESLKDNWQTPVIAVIFYVALSTPFFILDELGSILMILVEGHFSFGLILISLSIARSEDSSLDQLFAGFKQYGRILQTYLLQLIFVVLWSLLLIIPGIIAALSYSMAFYLMADDKDLPPRAAIDISKDMMYGYKLQLFYLYLSFIGWFFLSLLTLGIGILWLVPYVKVSVSKFYDERRKSYLNLAENL